jgi:hypothetical protein
LLLHLVPERFLNAQLAPLDMIVLLQQVFRVTCQDLRADARAVVQANSMVDSMEMAMQGNGVRALRRGWFRPGGDNVPRVAIPWPQDFIIGHGKKSRLCYDDLTVFEWTQGCLTIVEREEDMSVARGMLALLRAMLRDAAYHRFEAARYSYGCILSMMEDSILHWNNTTCIAEEHRSALIVRGTQVVPTKDSVLNAYPSRKGFSASKGGESAYKSKNNPKLSELSGRPSAAAVHILEQQGVPPESRSPKRGDSMETRMSQMPGSSAHG